MSRSISRGVRQRLLVAMASGLACLTGTDRALSQPCIDTGVEYLGDNCSLGNLYVLGDGIFEFSTTLCGALNDFDLGEGNVCTGTSTPGPDLQLTFQFLPAGGPPCLIDVFLSYCDSTAFDGALYLVGDCKNPAGSCLDGSDNTGVGVEELVEISATPGSSYTLIVDSKDSLCGRFLLTVFAQCLGDPTATDAKSWGSVKGLFK